MEGSDEEWLDWRVDDPSGTGTHQAEDENRTTGEGISVAGAAEIPRFAKRSKTRSFSQLVLGSPGSQKLLTAQLVPELPSSPKLLEAQLDLSAHSSSSQPQQ